VESLSLVYRFIRITSPFLSFLQAIVVNILGGSVSSGLSMSADLRGAAECRMIFPIRAVSAEFPCGTPGERSFPSSPLWQRYLAEFTRHPIESTPRRQIFFGAADDGLPSAGHVTERCQLWISSLVAWDWSG